MKLGRRAVTLAEVTESITLYRVAEPIWHTRCAVDPRDCGVFEAGSFLVISESAYFSLKNMHFSNRRKLVEFGP
jgi:hypothetical protein